MRSAFRVPSVVLLVSALLLLQPPQTWPAGEEEASEPRGPALSPPAEAEDPFDGEDDESLDDELFGELFGDDEEPVITDPFEKINRGFFWFNDKFYFWLLKPTARAWRRVPEPARISVGNFFSNLFAPLRAVNCLLQGKGEDFGNELGRFMVNTTVGILGFSDQAKAMSGVVQVDEDFGQTLGVWGFGQGFYIVLPLLGPSSLRDAAGFAGDIVLDPIWWTAPERELLYLGIRGGSYVNTTSIDRDTYESIKERQIDPYAFVKNAYAQKRQEDVKK